MVRIVLDESGDKSLYSPQVALHKHFTFVFYSLLKINGLVYDLHPICTLRHNIYLQDM